MFKCIFIIKCDICKVINYVQYNLYFCIEMGVRFQTHKCNENNYDQLNGYCAIPL